MIKLFYIVSIILTLASCRKFVEVDPPPTSLTTVTVFNSDVAAQSAIAGVYSEMIKSGFASGDINSVTFLTSLSADEFELQDQQPNYNEFYNNQILPTNSALQSGLWSRAYEFIYASNAIIEGLALSTTITDETKTLLNAEAHFIRAFCHTYLTMLFGKVPVILQTDYRKNINASQLSREDVLNDVISDLHIAESGLPQDYSHAGNERVRPNKGAARAMLARAYLYAHRWEKAEEYASLVIEDSQYSMPDQLNAVFLKNSEETIWQLKPVLENYNTIEGNNFIVTELPKFGVLHPALYTSFEPGDLRKTMWVDSVIIEGTTYLFPHKYKIIFDPIHYEYSMVLRLSEQYLIRAEAKANLNDINGSQEDLDVIRSRAGLLNTIASDQSSLLAAILQERQHELFTEWGHRWIDLQRSEKADEILSVLKPGWQPFDILYPIPQSQLNNSNNISQNTGY